jgi:hypothetical protein
MCRRARRGGIHHPPTEKERANASEAGFRVAGSLGEFFIGMVCPWGDVTLKDLKIIAITCEFLTGIVFPRDFQRRRSLIFKWLSDHYHEIAPIAQIVKLYREPLSA